MQLFYASDLEGDQYTFDELESKHIIRVLRLKAGDNIHLTDGKGGMFSAILVSEDPKRCEVRILETHSEYGKRDYQVHIAIAPTKNISRFEWFLEKGTEIGVDNILPMLTERSERRVIKKDRLNKVITAAVKQSVKAYHPQLHDLSTYKEVIESDFTGAKFIAYVEEGEHPLLQDVYNRGSEALILIGPEGDFSPVEIKMAIEAGFKTVSLGKSRLRTETAGVVAVHTVALVNKE